MLPGAPSANWKAAKNKQMKRLKISTKCIRVSWRFSKREKPAIDHHVKTSVACTGKLSETLKK